MTFKTQPATAPNRELLRRRQKTEDNTKNTEKKFKPNDHRNAQIHITKTDKTTMDESLLPDNGGNINGSSDVLSASRASLQRSSSLLERIRAQRERETMETSASSTAGNLPSMASDLPTSYGPSSTNLSESNARPGNFGRSMMGASSLNFSGLIRGFGNRSNNEATRGLLDASPLPEEYSMESYFRTFVMDIYTFYRSLPIPVQAGGVVFMLWIIYKLV